MTPYQAELYHHGVKGMKWGVRRYQNPDGSLTAAGKKRHARDVRENLARKKENRINTDEPDPKRWAKEDTERAKKVVDTSSQLVNQMKTIERETSPKPVRQEFDLSKMTDAELRQAVNRATLEKQYNSLYAKEMQPTISKGRERARNILETAGSVLAVGSSALGIALAIKELRG